MIESIKKFFRWLLGNPTEETPTGQPEAVAPVKEQQPVRPPDPETDELEDAASLIEEIPGTPVTRSRSVRSRGLDGGDDPPELLEIGEVEEIEETEWGNVEVTKLTPLRKQTYLWCLDNGHGELQEGKRSPKFPDGTRFEEWEFNRDIVRRIIEKLKELGIAYYNVVPETQVGSFLAGRVGRANEKQSDLPKLYVSIHANAAPLEQPDTFRNGITGIETFHFPGSQSGRRMATVFQKHLIETVGWRDRGVKEYPFYVLKHTAMPSVLTENGFYTDFEQTTQLQSDEWRQKIADAHVKAIVEIELADGGNAT
jgi:N-acetylmuramoyl-L-alanine amidase